MHCTLALHHLELMPFNAKWTNKGVDWIFHGDVTGEEILAACMNIYGDSRFDSLTYKIVDFLGIGTIRLTEEIIKKIAYFDMAASKTNPNLKVAILSKDAVLDDYSALYAAYMTETAWKIQFFTDRQTLEAWVKKEL